MDNIDVVAATTRVARCWDVVRQDMRHAFRGLRQHPLFTGAIVGTLALGLGANATMFGVVDRLLFRPPAYLQDSDHVARVYFESLGESGAQRTYSSVNHATFSDLAAGATTVSLAAFTFGPMAMPLAPA